MVPGTIINQKIGSGYMNNQTALHSIYLHDKLINSKTEYFKIAVFVKKYKREFVFFMKKSKC